MQTRLRLIGFLAAVGLAGCEDEAPTVREVVADLAVALCDRIDRCCSPDQIICTAGRTLDRDECEELVRFWFRQYAYVSDDAIDDHRRKVDEDAVSECIEQIGLLTCRRLMGLLPSPCDDVFPGTQEAGDACYDASECEEGTLCSIVESGERGVCWPLQGEGKICSDHGQCAPDLYCSASGYSCQPRVEEESGCEVEREGVSAAPLCASGLLCDPDTERCFGPGALGDDCTTTGWCEPGLACLLVDGSPECGPPKANGEECISESECASASCDGTECVDSAECDAGWGIVGMLGCP